MPASDYFPDPSVIDGPTNVTINHPNPFTLAAGECRAIPLSIPRPAGMVADKQVAVFEATIANLSGGQVGVCRGSVQDRRSWCAVFIPDDHATFLVLQPGTPVDAEFAFTNTLDDFINAPVLVEVFGPDMEPSGAFSLNGLPLGEPFLTNVSFSSGATIPFAFTVEAPEPVYGVSHVVISTDEANTGDFFPLIAVTAVVLPPQMCLADCNSDGSLNILDFVCFQQQWQQQAAQGDCDANGQFNILDFVCFQQVFQAGCP